VAPCDPKCWSIVPPRSPAREGTTPKRYKKGIFLGIGNSDSVASVLMQSQSARAPLRMVSLFYRPKPLYPSAPVGLSHINVAFGIDGQCVGVGKFADLMARSTEA
jgi:hypothetical protein